MSESKEENISRVPMRMCAVTREKLPKKDLVRLALEDGKVVIDQKGKVRSRGLNIKPEVEVLEKLFKIGGIKRGLGVTLDESQTSELRNSFVKYVEIRTRGKQVVRISSDKLNQILKSK
jgi:predicted RNA-binding protein YlxR (DUF448 family)